MKVRTSPQPHHCQLRWCRGRQDKAAGGSPHLATILPPPSSAPCTSKGCSKVAHSINFRPRAEPSSPPMFTHTFSVHFQLVTLAIQLSQVSPPVHYCLLVTRTSKTNTVQVTFVNMQE